MIIYCSKPGALANQLILFAHLLVFSKEYNTKIIMSAFDKYYQYFEGTHNNFLLSYPLLISFPPFISTFVYKFFYLIARIVNKANVRKISIYTIHINWNEKVILNSDEFIILSKQYPILFLQGWQFRTQNLINKHYSLIRSFFTIRHQFVKNIQHIMLKWKVMYNTIICIHMRRGDYKNFEGGKYYYDWTFYKNLIVYLKNNLFLNQNTLFYLCSDENIPQQGFIYNDENIKIYISQHHFIEDMYVLYHSNYIIGPPSTFTMWASFIGKTPLYILHSTEKLPLSWNDFKCVQI